MAAKGCRWGSSWSVRASATRCCSTPLPGSKRDCTNHVHTLPQGGDEMIYELRIYHCVPGRLADRLKRFDTITLGIWKRHGIEQAGFWTTAIGDSNQALYYFLKWESLADREKKWAAFQADPEWNTKRAETEKNGAIVARVENCILAPTNFSAVK